MAHRGGTEDAESKNCSRQDARNAKKNIFYLSELGGLCAFARYILIFSCGPVALCLVSESSFTVNPEEPKAKATNRELGLSRTPVVTRLVTM